MNTEQQINTPAFNQPVETLLANHNTSNGGLSGEEAEKRLLQYGKNILPKGKKVTLVQVILRQFTSPLIYVLLVAGVVAFFLDEHADAFFIGLVLLVNALIGTIQEWKAETSALALQQMMKVNAHVKRNGKLVTVAAEDLVPGDVVVLESGHKVPADLRMLHVNNLSVEEAMLTGESVAIHKNPDQLYKDNIPLGEQLNMAFAGTTVISGRGTGLVVGTGENTEIGKIASSLKELETTKAPLVERMEQFAQRISIITLVACIFLGGVGYYNGIGLTEIFFFVVAIAVSAIPEGLPISMTVGLSIGTSRMAKRNVIVRKLTAVEGLGSCTMIATDKTGTLTVDQQTVRRIILPSGAKLKVSGEGYNGEGQITDDRDHVYTYKNHPELTSIIDAVSICNEGSLYPEDHVWNHHGDAVDISFLALAYKSGVIPDEILEEIRREGEIPFEAERQFAAAYYRRNGKLHIAVKGSVERLLEKTGNPDHPLAQQALELAREGYRVIAVAGNEVNVANLDELPSLELKGIIGLIDPVRKETPDAIAKCQKAGVGVSMITGDHPATALAIARELGMAEDENQLITGKELEQLGDPDAPAFFEKISKKRVFARVTPSQKQRIVAAFKNSGHFVAVTGDGVNDAPALKTANIGVAMGYGTDVAKDVSSIIVADNNFASIAAGIEEGRYTYSNLRKIIYLLISTGAAEVLMVLSAMLIRLPLPFLPVQLLWLNLVTNGIQDKTLAFEKGESYLMKQPPRRPTEGVFNKLMVWQTLTAALVMAASTLGLWYHLLYNFGWPEEQARNTVLLLMVLLQNFHVINCRSEMRSIFQIPLKHNKFLFLGILGAQGVHILAMQLPFMQTLLEIKPVPILDWAKLLGTAAIILVVMEIFKWIYGKKIFNFRDQG